MTKGKLSHVGSILAASRGVAIFIAVLWHVDILLFRYYPNYVIHESTFKFLWPLPLPLFFFLTGVSFSQIIQNNRVGLVANAVGTYSYLYVIWLLVYHLFFLAIGHEDFELGPVAIVKRMLLPAPELWFVAWLACCLALCTATRRLPREIQIGMALGIVVLIPSIGYKISNFALYNVLFVYLGVFQRETFLAFITVRPGVTFAVCAPLYAIIAGVMIPSEPFAHPMLAILQSTLGISAVVAGLRLIHQTRIVEMLAWLGRKSFQIYISTPIWLNLDIMVLSRLYPAGSHPSEHFVQAATLPLCIGVFGQSILTIHLIGRRSWLLSPPASILRPIEDAVARLLARITIPSLDGARMIGRFSRQRPDA
jgi:uncharacterized membrane protein YcfT